MGKKEYLKITLGADKQPHIECNILPNNLMIVFINWMAIDKDVREIIILSVVNYLRFTKEDDFLIKRLTRIAKDNKEDLI